MGDEHSRTVVYSVGQHVKKKKSKTAGEGPKESFFSSLKLVYKVLAGLGPAVFPWRLTEVGVLLY